MVNHSWFTTGVDLRFGSGRVERIHHTAIWILRGFWGSDMFSFAVICFYLKYVNVYIYIDRYIIMIMNIYIYIYRGFWLMMVVVFWYVLIHSVILHCFALCHIEDIYIYILLALNSFFGGLTSVYQTGQWWVNVRGLHSLHRDISKTSDSAKIRQKALMLKVKGSDSKKM